MEHSIIDKQYAEHYIWGHNCDSWVLVNNESFSVKQEHMPAGTSEQRHLHTYAQQFFFILKGMAVFYIGKEKLILTEQESILVQSGTEHYIANETTEGLDFLVISQPTTNNDRTTVEP